MAGQVREYKIRLSAAGKAQLEADLRQIGTSGERALGLIQRSTKPAAAGLREVSRDSALVQKQLSGIGQQVPAVQRLARLMSTTALTGSLVLFAKSSLDVAKVFQASMKRVEAATRAPSDQIAKLEQKARDLGSTTAFTASSAADAIEVLAKNGVSVSDILGGALDATLAMAGALGGELAPSADLATDIMQQFGLQASELPEIADRIAGAALTSKFGFDDLRKAIGQAGGVAGKFGVDVDEFLTALSATASAFSSGADAGTSFKTFLQRLTPDSKPAAAAMQKLGLEFFDAQGNMKSMQNIAGQLQDSLAGLSDEARNSSLKAIFGTDAIRTALLLADAGEAGFGALRDQIEAASAVEQTEVRMRGLEGALKEVASAWEALQLEAASKGGLELAEDAADRLSAALRFLTENFDEVEEIAERVSQALVVYLVGRGMKRVIAVAVASRAVLIEYAGQVSGVGTSAGRAARGLGRLAVAGRALSTMAGGPVGLAITAATLASLFINADKSADAIDRADNAVSGAKSALSAYAEASRQAAEAQDGLGGKVDETTRAILTQSRVKLQEAQRELQESQAALFGDLAGNGLFNGSELETMIAIIDRTLERKGKDNAYVEAADDAIKAFQRGEVEIGAVVAAIDQALAAGPEAKGIVAAYDDAIISDASLSDAIDGMLEYAAAVGIFSDELDDVNRQEFGSPEWIGAVQRLRDKMAEAAIAGQELSRLNGTLDFLALARQAAVGEVSLDALEAALLGNYELALQLAGVDAPFDPITDSAREAEAAAVSLAEKVGRVYDVHNERNNALPGDADRRERRTRLGGVVDKGILDFIANAEGTEGHSRARGYNTTLDYGKWTGGPQNLVNMTLNEILKLGDSMRTPENRATYEGGGSSALGRYQIVGTTLRGLIEKLGLSGDELYSPALQDRLGMELVRQRGDAAGLQKEWQGLQSVPRSMINDALGAQSISRVDPDLEKANAEAAERRADAAGKHRDALTQLVSLGDEHVAQLGLEEKLLGKSAGEAEYLRFMYDKLREAKAAGIDVDATVTASGETVRQVLERQARAAGDYADQLDRAGGKLKELSPEGQKARGVLGNIFEGLRTGAMSGTDAAMAMFDYLQKRILEAAFNPLLDYLAEMIGSIFSGGIGGTGGIIGSIFGLASGGEVKALAGGGPVSGFGRAPVKSELQYGGRAAGRLGGRGEPTQDNILFWGSAGEYMLKGAAARYYGTDYLDRLNNMEIPNYASGGTLGAGIPSPASLSSGTNSGGLLGGVVFGDVIVGDVGDRDPADVGSEIAASMAAELPNAIDARLQEQMRPGGALYAFAMNGGRG